MHDIGGRLLPPGHRVARVLILALLVTLATTVAASDTCRAVAGTVLAGGGRATAAIWRPLLHSDGWTRDWGPW